jgi:phasin
MSTEEETMAKQQTEHFDIPPEMRDFVQKTFDQAREAFDGLITAAHRTVDTLEGQAASTRKGAEDVRQKVMSFAEHNVATSFDFAQKLVRANDVQELMKLQADYLKAQMETFAQQAKELAEAATKAAAEATPKAKR